jgi:colanic acid/amylovoran biosynthesis glycosyltransferase
LKKKIVVISASFPYGKQETFLENELKFLSKHFKIHVISLYKFKEDDVVRPIDFDITLSKPVLQKNHVIRFVQGIFNNAPLLCFLSDLIGILRSKESKIQRLKRWYLELITFRSLLSHSDVKKAYDDFQTRGIYFYWGNAPIKLLPTNKKIFVRVHGSEVYPERNDGRINFSSIKFTNKKNLIYLPISVIAERKLLILCKNANTVISRLGTYDRGRNPEPLPTMIRVVTCSSVIKLKRLNLVVKALMSITDQRIEWVHFGDGNLTQCLNSDADNLPRNITFIDYGRQSNNIVMNYYKNYSIDIFINVSSTEGVPVSVMEALSFGIPCFATNVGGTSELVDNSVGKIVEKDFRTDELTKFIQNIKHESIQRNLRHNARVKWNSIANADKNYSSLKSLLNHQLQV